MRSGIPQLYKFTAPAADVIDGANMLRPLTSEHDILDLRDLMNCAVLEGHRPKRMYISFMNLLFAVIQGFLLVALVMFAPPMVQNKTLWICSEAKPSIIFEMWPPTMWTLAALIGTFVASSFFRPDETLHLSPLTAATTLVDCEYCSLDAAPPPARVIGPLAQYRSYVKRNRGTFTFNSISVLKIGQYVTGIIPLFKHLIFIQKSPHPMILILRPAADTGQYPKQPGTLLYSVCSGFIQALLLIGLTMIFASIFGPSILEATVFITYFIAVTVVSRTYSIYYCLWMEKALSTTIIEYGTPCEYRAIKAIVAGMPSAVVENLTDGSTYGDGYRLDHNPDCPDHPTTGARPCPRTFGRLLGLAVAILVLPPMGLLSTRFPALVFPEFGPAERVFQAPVSKLYTRVLSFEIFFMIQLALGGLCVISKIISDFDSVDIHRGNTSAATATYGPVSQV